MRAVAIAPGTRLDRYEIVRHLATGGMAEIYLARVGGIGAFERYAVVKVIAGERRGHAPFVQMFLDEARLAAGLHHANIAQVYDVGEADGEFFYAMEYVHGDTVRSLLEACAQRQVRVPLDVAIAIAIGAASGLHHAHERCGPDGSPLDIVHRDVSPSNIMVGHDGAVKVLDFGIARASARVTETESGVVKGKYAYMAPEQCRAQQVDRRADVFALGIVLYELTTQHRAFKADSDFETMSRIVNGELAPPSMVRPGYPPGLEAIVARAMAVAPERRYQTAGDLGDALEAYAEGAGLTISQRAVARFMHQVFGAPVEPWRTSGGHAAVSPGGTPRSGPPLPLSPPPSSQPSAQRALTPLPLTTPLPAAPPVAPAPRTDSMVASEMALAPEPPPRSLARPLALGLGLAAVGVVIAVVMASGGGAGSRAGAAAPDPTPVAAAAPVEPPTAPSAAAPAGPPPATAPTPVAPVEPPAPPPAVERGAPPATAPAPPAASATVTLHVTSSPPGAAVYLDNHKRGTTPLDVAVPRGRSVTLRLERGGFRVAQLTVPTAADRAVTVTLKRAAARPPADDGFANPFAK